LIGLSQCSLDLSVGGFDSSFNSFSLGVKTAVVAIGAENDARTYEQQHYE
jgi:hypothetical protein